MKTTVLMIIPNLGQGGAQRSFSNISNELSRNFNVINVVFNRDSEQAYPLSANTLSLDVAGGSYLTSKLRNFMRRVIRLRQIKKNYKVDVSISFLEGADYVNILSKLNDTVILSIRGSKLYDGNIKGWQGFVRKKLLIPWLYARANAIVAVNKGIIEELNGSFKLKAVDKKVIHNFYDREQILDLAEEPFPRQFQWLTREKYLIISSRLAREKNILPLLSVFAVLKRKGFDGKLVLVGSGPEDLKIPGHCNQLSLNIYNPDKSNSLVADVILVGPDTNPYKYIKHALFFLLASESEGFPNSLVETMMLGVPVISSDCPWGPGEILNPNQARKDFVSEPLLAEYGVLVPQLTGDEAKIESWGKWLSEIIQDKALHEYYRLRSIKGTGLYTKESALPLWESLIKTSN